MRSQLLSVASAVLVGILLNALASGAEPAVVDQRADSTSNASPAAHLVAAALQAEANGQAENRDALLRRASAADPEFAAAHWHRGELRIGDRWLTLDEAMRQTTAEGKIFEYNNRRIATGGSAAGQLELAQWCGEQGMVEQHRAHALLALAADPNLADARSELSLSLFNGTWLTPDEIADQQRKIAEATQQYEHWKPRLAQLLRMLHKSSTARDALRSLNDPAAIPAIESLLSLKNQRSALLAVEALSNMKQQAATESLVRHAVLSAWEEVREAAAKALHDRSIYSYAPLLLAGLQAPIEVDYVTIDEGIGSWSYRCQLFREGPLADSSYEAIFRQQRVPNAVGNPSELADNNEPRREAAGVAFRSRQGQQRTLNAAAAMAQRIAAANAQTQFVNARIGAALTLATEGTEASPSLLKQSTSLADKTDPSADPTHPRYWWTWWFDYNDIDYTGSRSLTEYSEYERTRITPTGCECFVAGTPVWTPTGPMSIDLVRPGDLVLAQHPETGEIAYKPVLANTVRPPVGLLKIGTGETELVATRGHPLWVSGQGWRMARELKIGDLLHTLSGPRAITSIEPAPKAKAYNLVVDRFNTFFVGADRILAHDNNLRQPTDTVVPGLAAR